MPYSEHYEELAPLESVPAEAFLSDGTTSRELCDFVLALALIYNDLRDLHSAHLLLNEVMPREPELKTAECGLHNGLRLHVMRLQVGLVDELLNVVRKRRTVLEEPMFRSVFLQLSKDAKRRWAAIVSVALEKKTGDETAKKLAIIRNKVAFHYDPEEIGRGYREKFPGKGEQTARPMLSRGGNLATTRFYFADAAAQESVLPRGQRSLDDDFYEGAGLVFDLNVALHNIVTRFVQTRGFVWRREHSP